MQAKTTLVTLLFDQIVHDRELLFDKISSDNKKLRMPIISNKTRLFKSSSILVDNWSCFEKNIYKNHISFSRHNLVKFSITIIPLKNIIYLK